MALSDLFRRKRARKLYFAIVVADRPADGFKFEGDKDCRMFLANGEITPGVGIPSTVIKSILEKFDAPAPLDGKVTVSEKFV
jgi:hypothetical protein